MRKLIWIPIAILIGLLDGLLGSTFSVSGMGFSLTIAAVVALFSTEGYSVAIFFVILASTIKHLLAGAHLGWFELFGTIAITLVGVVRYFIGGADRWIQWVSSVVLLLALYFFDFLLLRNFDLGQISLLRSVNFGGVVLWIIMNVGFVLLLHWLFTRLGKWTQNED